MNPQRKPIIAGNWKMYKTAAAAGLRTVVIENGAEVGGLCILRG